MKSFIEMDRNYPKKSGNFNPSKICLFNSFVLNEIASAIGFQLMDKNNHAKINDNDFLSCQ